MKIGLHGVQPEHLQLLQIAYEPVWSIGAGGTPASPEDVAPIAKLIRSGCQDLFAEPGSEIPNSVWRQLRPEQRRNPHRAPDIDGLFVGRAAWSVEGFIATYQAGYEGVTVIG